MAEKFDLNLSEYPGFEQIVEVANGNSQQKL